MPRYQWWVVSLFLLLVLVPALWVLVRGHLEVIPCLTVVQTQRSPFPAGFKPC